MVDSDSEIERVSDSEEHISESSSDSDSDEEYRLNLRVYDNLPPERKAEVSIKIQNDRTYRINKKNREKRKKFLEEQLKMPYEIINGRKALKDILDNNYRYIYVDSLNKYVKLKPLKNGKFLDEKGGRFDDDWFGS
jgi:hypothetical protein